MRDGSAISAATPCSGRRSRPSRRFAALARERPLCLVWEDLHWADESTLELVEELFDLADREATTIVLLYRSEREHGSWHLGERARQRFPHRLVELDLRPLAPKESTALAAGAAGGELPDEVGDLLAARAGGNPFFLEEAVRDLVERGVLHPVDTHWELTIAVEDLTVPLLVQETLQARLDRLEPATREVASIASVIGRTFGLPLLERLTDHDRLAPALSELLRLDLVVEERRRPAPEYRFRHGLVQEVAYASLTESRRRELHLAVARAIEELHADTPEEAYEALARHFSQAADSDKAVEYLLKAGDAAWALYADPAARDHYRNALEFMDPDDGRASALLFKIALAHHVDFDFAEANAVWARAFASAAPAPTGRTASERLVTAVVPLVPWVPAPGHNDDVTGSWLTADLFSGLLRLERGLNLVADAAAELRVSDDGLRYRARMRSDAVWSDGEPLTAHDFVCAWHGIREQGLPTAHLLEDVAEATAVDDRTLEITLHAPRPYFPYLLALPPLFAWPRHRFEHLADAWLEPPSLVSNGAFNLAEQDENHALLVANERWHGRRGNVAEVLLLFMSREETIAAWERGDLDLQPTWPPPPPEHAVVEQTAWLMTEYVGFVANAAPFDDLRVRRAFAHALDRARFVEERRGAGEPATTGGFVPQAMPGHSHRIGLDHDPARARELLADAGYPEGRGLPEVRLATPAEWGAAELVAEQWREHLHAEVTVVSFPADGDPRLIDPPAACWIHGWIADFPDPAGFLVSALTSASGTATALDRAPQILGLVETILAARDRDERLRLVAELERGWLSERVAMVPLRYGSQLWVRRPWVGGFWTTPILPGHLSDIVIRR
jgi:ABC-type transport system substrate-binding protein